MNKQPDFIKPATPLYNADQGGLFYFGRHLAAAEAPNIKEPKKFEQQWARLNLCHLIIQD